MPIADFTAMDAMWICLAVFLVVVAVALAILLLRLAGTAGRLTSLLASLELSAIPLLNKASVSLDHVNKQLGKVDLVTDSAVDAADKADTAVRAVSMAVTAPVTKVSGLAKGVSHGTSAFMAGNDFKSSVAAGRDAARRREREIGEELDAGRPPCGRGRCRRPAATRGSHGRRRGRRAGLSDTPSAARDRRGDGGSAERASGRAAAAQRLIGTGERPGRSDLQSDRAHEPPATGGVSRVLRRARARAPAVRVARPGYLRPLGPPDDGRHAAPEAVLPRPGETARGPADHSPEMLSCDRYRRSRADCSPSHVLRDARQLLDGRLLQGRGDRPCLGVRDGAHAPSHRAPLGDRVRGRPGARARRGRAWPSPAGSASGYRPTASAACRGPRTSGRRARRGRAAPARSSTSTAVPSTAADATTALRAANATATSSSGTSSSWSSTSTRTAG